jgi:hypothetical protein
MTCRLYVDEVGNDDVNHPAEQYLSLTGIITKVVSHDKLITPQIESLKTDLFGHSMPNNMIILHRKEILRREPPFHTLNDPVKNAEWEARVLDLIDKLPFLVNTVMIDKHAHRDKYTVWLFNPYHYCMRALIERYILWLNRHHLSGDVMVEPRFKKVDKALKKSFEFIYEHGTEHIPAHVIQRCLSSREIKFSAKRENVCGLQIVDLIAHPAHQGTKELYAGHVMKQSFGSKIYEVLERKKFSRNPKTFKIDGWGQKWLPQK